MSENINGASGGDQENDSSSDDAEEACDTGNVLESLRDFLGNLNLGNAGGSKEDKPKIEQFLGEVSLNGIANYIESDKCKNIIVMCGAGISTAAGIPDFRSPGSGLYDNLQKYDMPSPQSMFEISFFKENPEPFFTLAKELYPGEFNPTTSHYFVKLLEEKGFLLRIYTQNIDTLERVAGISQEKIVEAHGTFHTSHCLLCDAEYSQEWMRDVVFSDKIPRCVKEDCHNGLVKPDIVFFGEALPERFHIKRKDDFKNCDLLIVMGTSLKVQPFASLVDSVPDTTPRLLINMEKSGDSFFSLMGLGGGMKFDDENNYRDVFWQGPCDDGCRALCSLLGWLKDLDNLVAKVKKSSSSGESSSSAKSKC